ncbi:MAG: myosin heavy subunit [Saprospiraceae bacterium]|jgi:myosin heavy subunit|tara:strand:+ start:974 stop:1951 length:978 start_codon:yes stop_codon:yes gene_type:complete
MTLKSKNNLSAMAIIAIIALIGLNGYQWFSNSQLETQNIRQETELVELEKVQAELEQDYTAALEGLEDMRSDNTELNSLIESQKVELKSQKDKINNLIWTKRELNKAKDEIANMNSQAAQYVAELAQLRDENANLMANNSQLMQQNSSLNTQYLNEQTAKREIEAARAVLAVEKEKLAKTNEVLDTKVDMANAIKINFMKVQGYQLKDDGKKKKKSRAKNINLIEVCFTTESNLVTPAGQKEFQIRLIDPLGETVAREDMGSGVLTNKLDNTQVRYTSTGIIEYNNEDTDGCIQWKVSDRLPKGMYDVEIYNNGFKVGNGNYKMK